MHNISKNLRRATRDLDLDFIKYSLGDEPIRNFINELDKSIDGISFEILDPIVSLCHQDYKGKRIILRIKDKFNNSMDSKLDIVVHNLFNLEQELYAFNFDIIELGANLLINSCEQIFAEKMKSLLRFNIKSTRYKDIFDFYYLIDNNLLNKDKLNNCFNVLIYSDVSMNVNNIIDLSEQFKNITNSRFYKNNLNNPKYNWLDINIDEAIKKIQTFLNSITTISV